MSKKIMSAVLAALMLTAVPANVFASTKTFPTVESVEFSEKIYDEILGEYLTLSLFKFQIHNIDHKVLIQMEK